MSVLANTTTLFARPCPDKGKLVCGFSANVGKIHFFYVRTRYARVLASTQNAISQKRNWFGDMDADLKDAFFEFKHEVQVMGKRPNQMVARKLIERLCRVRKTRRAIEVVEIMLGAGVLPAKESYMLLVDHFCGRGNVWFAMQFIERMEENGHVVNPKAYNRVLKGLCCTRKWWDKIPGWLDLYVEKGLYLNHNARSYLLSIISRVRGVDETKMFLDEMIITKGWKPTIFSYNVILNGLCRNNRTYEAIHLLDDLTPKGLRSKGYSHNIPLLNLLSDLNIKRLCPDAYSYNIPLLSLCMKGEWLEVKKLLAKMDARGVLRSRDTYNILISILAQHGEIEEAFRYLEEMLRVPMVPTTATYNPIIQQLCKEGKVDHSISRINEMIFRRCYPDDGTYKAIAELCKGGKVKEAFAIIQFLEQKQNSTSHYFYKGVVSALCRKGETVSAVELLYEMVSNGFVPNSYTYAAVIKGLFREGKLDEAEQIALLVEENHWRLDIEIFNALVQGYSRGGRMPLRSLELFGLMLEKGCKPNEMTYTCIVEGIFEAGEEELASEVLQELHRRNVISDRTAERFEYQLDSKKHSLASVCE